MTSVTKIHGETIEAYELGKFLDKETLLVNKIKLIHNNGYYEIFYYKNDKKHAMVAFEGDFLSFDNSGIPTVYIREDFLKKYKHFRENIYETKTPELLAWECWEPISKEVQFLLDNKLIFLNYGSTNSFFVVKNEYDETTYPSDSFLIFNEIDYRDNKISDISFTILTRDEFHKKFKYCD